MSAELHIPSACSGDRLLVGSQRPADTGVYFYHRVAMAVFFGILFRVTATGRRYIPLEGPVIIAANHASYVDPLIIGVMSPRMVTPMAKQELWRIPPLGWWLSTVGVLPVNRGAATSGIGMAVEAVRSGKALLVFPEGTRTSDGEIAPFKRGVGWIACRSRAPVVPTFIDGSYQAYSRHRLIPRPHRVTLHFGKPILPSDVDGDDRERVNLLTKRIEESVHELKARFQRPCHG